MYCMIYESSNRSNGNMNAQLAEATINVIIAQKCTASRGNYYIVMSNDDIL